MSTERCPSCGGAVRAGDPWCTLCWTDLRPKPAPAPPPPPAPVAVPVAAVPAPAAASLGPLGDTPIAAAVAVDPLTAPLSAVLGQPLAADPGAPPSLVTWPCVECGSANSIDLDACSVCTAPFGGRIARLEDPKAARRKFLVISLGAVATFLMLLGALTFVLTDADTAAPGGGGDPFETSIDYSKLPQE